MVNINITMKCQKRLQLEWHSDHFTNIWLEETCSLTLKEYNFKYVWIWARQEPIKRRARCSLFPSVQVLFSLPGLPANCTIMFYVAVQLRFTLLFFPTCSFISRLSNRYASVFMLYLSVSVWIHFYFIEDNKGGRSPSRNMNQIQWVLESHVLLFFKSAS